MMNAIKKLSLSLCLMLLVGYAVAQNAEVFSAHGHAIKGYDPVSYFTESKPVKGKEEFSYIYKGATWLFSSQKNMDLFKADPVKFMPQYGGYCAFGLAGGYKAPISPDAWSIVDGKLYLNYNQKVQKDWTADQEEMIKKADEHWPTVKKKEE